MKSSTLCALVAGLLLGLDALAQEPPPRLVIKLQRGAAPWGPALPDGAGRESALSATRSLSAGASYLRATASARHVVELPAGTTPAQAAGIARALSRQPGVERVELDRLMRPHVHAVPAPKAWTAAPTFDSYSHHQWPLMERDPARAGRANFRSAWDRTAASDAVVVAILDSGSTLHPDTADREQGGFDMVSDPAFAADGGGRDADPSDPGDYCAHGIGDSDWHGTAVAGLIGAVADNGYGIAGAAHGARLQHVRVIGRCGAWSSDVADAIVWAAGGRVPGLPGNPTPAQVINLSLGAPVDRCSAFMQEAVDAALRRGAVVVASAGNEGRRGIDMPANCAGAIAVAAATESGDLARYSNHAPGITLAAPAGGECRRQGASCIPSGTATLGTIGRTLFEQHAEVRYFGGTSAAAPHVAAAVALMRSANPHLTPGEVSSILRTTAYRDFPPDSFCATGNHCGAGFLDAQAAVAAADRVVLSVAGLPGPVRPGERVSLAASLTHGGVPAAPATVQWLQRGGPAVAMGGADSLTMSFTVPALTARQDFAFEAVAFLPDGRVARDSVLVRTNVAPTLSRTRIEAGLAPLSEPLGLPSVDGVTVQLVEGPAGLAVVDGMLVWPEPAAGTHEVVLRTSDGEFESDDQVIVLRVAAPAPPAEEGGGGTMSSAWVALLALAAAWLDRLSSTRRPSRPR